MEVQGKGRKGKTLCMGVFEKKEGMSYRECDGEGEVTLYEGLSGR